MLSVQVFFDPFLYTIGEVEAIRDAMAIYCPIAGKRCLGYSALNPNVGGRLAARQLERGYISVYLGRYGHCPPGHRGRGCR